MRRLIFALFLLSAPVHAQDVELELVLLADASGSIDSAEITFQRQGYAEAITDPRVLKAITDTSLGNIAVTYVEWASAGEEQVVVPWTIIDSAATAEAFAKALFLPPRTAFGSNAIGSALLTGMRLIEGNDITSWRKVIDFSGDSARNWSGPSIEDARAEVLAAGITINGLPILCRRCNGRPSTADLEKIYAEQIIGGHGAFVVTAENDESFADAVRRKLILEISGQMPAQKLAQMK
ncbi:DUF1194 domain-containing protein [Actibacterium lipolyticum]|uniref:DUF1194 domain-containing protein n=1 Tax=Actibacterium lipolyticum TaxID=1524263 RepID=A0A238JQ51_9RHOB|nr:DUF1194 domain-containing protein [Actibacterium lipolyticum]SMX32781.1 hypothetical protein COL8621_00892 [Actibacterium lipolyticum]